MPAPAEQIADSVRAARADTSCPSETITLPIADSLPPVDYARELKRRKQAGRIDSPSGL
jgi:hypothetical protein